MAESAADRLPERQRSAELGAAHGASGPRRHAHGGNPFRIYKPGQGTNVRWGSAAGMGVISIAFASFLFSQLARVTQVFWIKMLMPVVLLLVLALVVFRLLGQSRTIVDFMIATEGEMKKVSWSTRREVLGATRVVIAAVLALGFLLFAADMLFMTVFRFINVLRIDG